MNSYYFQYSLWFSLVPLNCVSLNLKYWSNILKISPVLVVALCQNREFALSSKMVVLLYLYVYSLCRGVFLCAAWRWIISGLLCLFWLGMEWDCSDDTGPNDSKGKLNFLSCCAARWAPAILAGSTYALCLFLWISSGLAQGWGHTALRGSFSFICTCVGKHTYSVDYLLWVYVYS